MSNIYIQEPPTNGKVLLKTTAGEIEVELWSKEAPKTCRNFIQLIMDRFYDKSPFHRLVPNFIVQCGMNTEKADLIEPIKNEFHSRLRFMRRGLLGMATNEGSDNNMEFFFTLNATPELQNTHTIFGKVTGETIYNLLKLSESEIDANERPLHPHKINKIKILHNPFDDLSPREDLRSKKGSKEEKKQKKEGVKNFKLISFGDEAEQDEDEVNILSKDQPKVTQEEPQQSPSSSKRKNDQKKIEKSPSPEPQTPPRNKSSEKVQDDDDSDSDLEYSLEKEKLAEMERKKRKIQEEIENFKKDYHKERKEKKQRKDDEEIAASSSKKSSNPAVQDYLDEKEKYKRNKINVKGASRENFTLQLLEKFKAKIQSTTKVSQPETATTTAGDDNDDDAWMSHKLDFSESTTAVLAKDASKKEDDWYDIYDPRNPLAKRRRGGDEKSDKPNKMRR